jgi:hypothetical protein
MKRTKSTYLALVVLLLPMAAIADLIDAGGSTIDSSSGLEWLDMDLTLGHSILEIEASAYFGEYRWATESEILGLFEYVYSPRVAGDFVDRYDADEWALASELIALLGPTGNYLGPYVEGISREVSLGPDMYGRPLFGRGYMWAIDDGSNEWLSRSPSGACCFYETDSRADIGGWLVRTVQVPEPGTLAILSIGLAAMRLSRRRKKV